jgi:hypothetical protein
MWIWQPSNYMPLVLSLSLSLTIAERKRHLPTINSPNGQQRAAAERQAINTICQGSAADLAKVWFASSNSWKQIVS